MGGVGRHTRGSWLWPSPSWRPPPVVLPPLGTLELFVELNDASGGSGANFIIKWNAEQPINPPLVESLHANMDGGKAVIFMTQSVPVED